MTTKIKITLEEHVGWDVTVKVFDLDHYHHEDNYPSPYPVWIENESERVILNKAGDSVEKYAWDTRRIEVSEILQND